LEQDKDAKLKVRVKIEYKANNETTQICVDASVNVRVTTNVVVGDSSSIVTNIWTGVKSIFRKKRK